MEKNVYRYIHKNISRYRICPISIRNYLNVEFVLDISDNINSYDESRVFYLNEKEIVIKYRIQDSNKEIFDIPVINSKDICDKISLHREFMIKRKYNHFIYNKKRVKDVSYILNFFLPNEMIINIIVHL